MTATLLSEVEAELACLDRLEECLEDLLACEPGRLPAAAKTPVVERVARLESRLAAWKLRLLASAGDAARAEGHRDAAAWFASHTHTDTGAARSAQRTAEALQTAPGVADALGQGRVSERHAKTILDSLEALPPVSPVLRRQAEQALIDHAARMTPKKLTELGKGILDQIDPAGDHHQLEQTLADQAAHAWAQTQISIRDRGDGISDIQAVVPATIATRLRTYLEALSSPRRVSTRGYAATQPTGLGYAAAQPTDGGYAATQPTGAGYAATSTGVGSVDRVPHSIRMGRAFCTLVEHTDPAGLPRHGGTATTLMVTINHRDLTSDLGTAQLIDTNHTKISGGEARRLACTAAIIPVVLGTNSEVLDLGRSARFFTPAQVKALRTRHRTCQADGCDIPSTWCEAHHLTPWSRGGTTNLKDGVLLCSHHHHLIHNPDYQHQAKRDGTITFRLRR